MDFRYAGDLIVHSFIIYRLASLIQISSLSWIDLPVWIVGVQILPGFHICTQTLT